MLLPLLLRSAPPFVTMGGGGGGRCGLLPAAPPLVLVLVLDSAAEWLSGKGATGDICPRASLCSALFVWGVDRGFKEGGMIMPMDEAELEGTYASQPTPSQR